MKSSRHETAIVLTSGGLDSAVNLAMAAENHEKVIAFFMDYGQKAMKREKKAASSLAAFLSCDFISLNLDFFRNMGSSSALTDGESDIPELSNLEQSTVKSVWVPNRNGLFINVCAAYAEKFSKAVIYTGFNAEEAAHFPDNSADFIAAINVSLGYSTAVDVTVDSYTIDMVKNDIAQRAIELGIPSDMIWSCYSGDEKMCGRCESCSRFRAAFESCGEAGIKYIESSLPGEKLKCSDTA